MMRPLRFLFLCAATLAAAGCANKPAMGRTRDSGQSDLMGQTFAGQNACNPDNHLKPFIIEWDATDMSSFESHAANDVIVVRYEGCNLVVLDECRNESIRGAQGSYRPPEWTSGSLESIDISNEGELYAKLPLGGATLGGRVNGGEKFHMEYYVAGKREATRDAVYRDDLESNPGCEGATHFVHGFNLGAFALGSAAEVNSEFGGSVYGFGAGGSTSSQKKADKKGGDLAVCRSDSATEVEGCKAPIRLSLRKIRDGEDPDKAAMRAPASDASLSAVGLINHNVQMSKEATARMQSAVSKMNARDGKGCIKELDAQAKLAPQANSQDPKSGLAGVRAQCLMLAGKCDAGKKLLRKVYEQGGNAWTPERMDTQVSTFNRLYCQGKLSNRDKLIKSYDALAIAANANKESAKFCGAKYSEIKKLAAKVKPRDFDDAPVNNAKNAKQLKGLYWGCLARANACTPLFKAWRSDLLADLKPADRKYWDDNPGKLKDNFNGQFKRCAK